jgi:hypothetical protein
VKALAEIIATNPGGFALLFLGLFGTCVIIVGGLVGFVHWLDDRADAEAAKAEARRNAVDYERDYRSRRAEWVGKEVRNELRALAKGRAA